MIGTGPYMAPELVQFMRTDLRSDLFARGVMLYHLTTGARPFGSPDTVRGPRRRLYVDRADKIIGLKHGARSISKVLDLAEGRFTFHVLEAPDAAAAIVEFAERNQVDHIVMGARANSALRRYLGSVSSQLVAQSPCTVTVVRV